MEHSCHDETKVAKFHSGHVARGHCCILGCMGQKRSAESFLTDNRRGYARITPVGLTSTGVPGQELPPADQYSLHGLWFCDEKESTAQFTTYVWSSWTGKAVQPTHVDQNIQDLLNRPRGSANTGVNQSKLCDQQNKSSDSANKGSDGLSNTIHSAQG